MELLISTIIIWALILIPPATIRALRSMPLTKMSAGLLVAGLFLVNHLILAVLTGKASERTYLLVGAFVSYFVLTWQSKLGAKKAVEAERRHFGYDVEETPAPAPPSVASREAITGAASKERVIESMPFVGPSPTPRVASEEINRDALAPATAARKASGWLRIWIVLSLVWTTLVLGRLALEMNGEAEQLLVDS